jgi:raffinose/stachyose/melibiose transport system permease protein
LEKAIRKWFPLFLLPTLLAFILSFVIPFIMGVVLSFCKFYMVTDAEWQGLEGYKYIFEDPRNSFVEAFKFTTTFSIVAVILINVFAFLLANLLTKRLRGTNFFRAIFFYA